MTATQKIFLPTCEEHLFLLRKQNSIKPMRCESFRFQSLTLISGSQTLFLGPVAPPGNLLNMQIPWSHPGPNDSETLGLGPRSLCLMTLQVILVHSKVPETAI